MLRNLRTNDGRFRNYIPIGQWQKHYTDLWSETRSEFAPPTTPTFREHLQVGSITLEEIDIAIRNLKIGKLSGPGGIAPELVKYGGLELKERLLHLFNLIAHLPDEIPKEWNTAYVFSIYKKGPKIKVLYKVADTRTTFSYLNN